MVEIPVQGVNSNDRTEEHLWRHRLDISDAEEVWLGPAKYFEQKNRQEFDEFGQPWTQPARVVMIGPDFGGRLLTFILAQPDEYGESRVITGWPANREDRTRYHRPGGRMRTR